MRWDRNSPRLFRCECIGQYAALDQLGDDLDNPMFATLHKLIGDRLFRRMAWIVVLMSIGAFLEMLGVVLIVAVCGLILSAGEILSASQLDWLVSFFHIQTEIQFTLLILVFAVLLYVFKGIYLLCVNAYVNSYAVACYQQASSTVFQRLLIWPAEVYLNEPKERINRYLYHDVQFFHQYLNALLRIIPEALVAGTIAIFLLILNPFMTLFCLAGLAIAFFVAQVFIKRKVLQISEDIKEARGVRSHIISQTFSGYKAIRIYQKEPWFLKRFKPANEEFGKVQEEKNLWVKQGTVAMESIVVLSILLYMLLMLAVGADLISLIPDLSGLAFAAVRLLPAVSRIGNYKNEIDYSRSAMMELNEMLTRDVPLSDVTTSHDIGVGTNTDLSTLHFQDLKLENLTYRHDETPDVLLDDLSLDVRAGESLAIIGHSGAGKSTLLELLLGLRTPQAGAVLVDGQNIADDLSAYYNLISYAPQGTFILDGSVRTNVAFALNDEEIDDQRVWRALEDAALDDRVRNMKDGLDTLLGNGGITLSGGERKRLGLARALYRDRPILFLDEPSASLDNRTGARIVETLQNLRGIKTIILVTHSKGALVCCDRVVRLEGGHLSDVTDDD